MDKTYKSLIIIILDPQIILYLHLHLQYAKKVTDSIR